MRVGEFNENQKKKYENNTFDDQGAFYKRESLDLIVIRNFDNSPEQNLPGHLIIFNDLELKEKVINQFFQGKMARMYRTERSWIVYCSHEILTKVLSKKDLITTLK